MKKNVLHNLEKFASGWYNEKWANVRDWNGAYSIISQSPQGKNMQRWLREELAALTQSSTTPESAIEALESQAAVGEVIRNLESYIAETPYSEAEAHSLAMANLMKRMLEDNIRISQVVGPNRANIEKALSSDYAQLRDGTAWEGYIKHHNSLHATLVAMSDRYKAGSFQRKYVDFLLNHSKVNDVKVVVNPQMQGKGLFRINQGVIELKSGMTEAEIFHTIMHEGTHAYFHRVGFKYNAALSRELSGATREEVLKDLELSEAEYHFMRTAQDMYETLRAEASKAVRRNPTKYADLDTDQDGVPYGVSFDSMSAEALPEFLAEMYSSAKFREWATETLTIANAEPRKTAWERIKDLIGSFFHVIHARNADVTVESFLENGFKLFSRSVEVDERNPNVLKLQSETSRASADQENGVRYYTFKRRKAFGEPELSGSARYDEETGTWEFNYADAEGVAQTEKGLNIDDVMQKALNMDMQVYGKSGVDSAGHFLQHQIDRAMMTNPRLARAIERFRTFLMNYLPEETVNNAIGRIYDFALSFEHYAMNRDALHTWIQRALMAQGHDAQSAQNILNDIQAKTQTFLNERGLNGEQTLADHKFAIAELGKQYGVTAEQLNDIVYALTAKHRKREFANNPGEIDPYTGLPVRDSSLVSGFSFKDAEGKIVRDDDGSKYLAQLSAEHTQFTQLLEERWIAQNNSVLDFELQAGAISQEQYNSQYGKFYAPLRNIDDQASAFYKRALGRTTKAASPATNYYNFANARIMYAQHQMKMGHLLDVALTQNVQSVIEVNQAHFVQDGKGLRKSWKGANKQDPAVITVWRGNTQYTMRITDTHIAEMIRKGDRREMTGVWQVLANVTRGMSLVRTSLSPTFVPAAFARDVLTAIGNVQGAFRDLGSASLTDAQSRELSMKIPATAMKAAISILSNNAKGTRSWEYDVFKRVGGGITMNSRYDFEQANDWLSAELSIAKDGTERPISNVLKRTKQTVKKATEISHAFEDATRFATFIEYLKLRNGGRDFRNEQELVSFLVANPELRKAAVTGSKSITGNFEVKGSNVGFRAAYMFFNASMVGLSTTVNMFDPRHGSHGLKFGMLMAGVMLASMAMVDADLGDDEDGKSKLSRVRKTGDNICIGGFCTPVPHEARPITNAVKSMYHLMRGDYTVGDATANVMHGVMQAGSPLQFDGFSSADNSMHTLLQGVMPTLGQLPLQLATGLNSFGRPIMPEYAYTADGQRIPDAMDWQKTKMTDPEWTKWTAMNLQKFLGIDASSSEIDHVAQFALGSIYTSVKKAGQATLSGASAGDIIYNFVGRSFGMEYDNRAIIDEAKEKLRILKTDLQMGDSVDNMLRATSDLKQDPRYAKLVALERQVQAAEKAMQYNGKSYAALYRQKQTGLATGDIDAILEANEGLDLLGEERRALFGDFYKQLEAFAEEKDYGE